MLFKERVLQAIGELETKLIEREELIRLTLLCIFAKHHMFLIGKPGVGKTYAIQIISKIISDGSYWEILMTKETQEKQLVGTEDTPREQTLLVHPFIFFDEMFKATDELLVALLALLNERRWTIGGKGVPVPLNSLFSASNELPFGEKIEPFSDRILVWYEVQRIKSRENKENYVRAKFNRSKESTVSFTMADIDKVQELASKVEINDEVLDYYLRLQSEILTYGIKASDRKFGPDFIVKSLKVAAVLNDRDALNLSDLLLLRHMSWTTYDERTKVAEVVNNIIFGNENNISGSIIKAKTAFKELFAQYDARCFNFVNFRIDYNTNIFNECLNYCQEFQQNASEVHQYIMDIFAHYEHSKEVLQQANDNILICEVRNFPFTETIIAAMEDIRYEVEIELKKINDFLRLYSDSYQYQQNLYAQKITPKE